MEKLKLWGIVTVFLLIIGLITITFYVSFKQEEQKPFYVGVTYCGSSVQEAKELIDKVKNYTNLFALTSGTLRNVTEVEEIGDYAIASNLSFVVYNSENVYYGKGTDLSFDFYNKDSIYYGNGTAKGINEWANVAKQKWKERFLGIYYRDEPGGDTLAGKLITFENVGYQLTANQSTSLLIPMLTKYEDTITVYKRETNQSTGRVLSTNTYWPDGRVNTRNYNRPFIDLIQYLPNGEITISRSLGNFRPAHIVYTAENITEYPHRVLSYEEVLKQNPIQNNDEAAKVFVDMHKGFLEDIDKKQLSKEDILVFTADYGLYWWDYKGGYDMVLAELAWNHSVTQEIALVRGAANFQGKSWGTILTWKYTHPPYLTDGVEMFEQMKVSYEAGAEYVLIFNYSEDPANPNTLQEEHFQALERFWNDVVQNPNVMHGGIKAEAVLILPQNYGCSLQSPDDHMWGIWPPEDNSQEIWSQIQDKLAQHGLKLDIIFEDPAYSSTGKYNHIYYWNRK
jgi:hypothetical protein